MRKQNLLYSIYLKNKKLIENYFSKIVIVFYIIFFSINNNKIYRYRRNIIIFKFGPTTGFNFYKYNSSYVNLS